MRRDEFASDERGGLPEALGALANPVRVELLEKLRSPKALSEIEVRTPEDGEEGRLLSRQAVKHHLDQLTETGVVVARKAERSYGETTEYIVDHRTLYALAERFRDLATLRPTDQPARQTWEEIPEASGLEPDQAALVIVKGLSVGRTVDLDPHQNEATWLIGRRRDADVSLDFDPYVSSKNALVRYEEGTFLVEDLPESRNGTRVNFAPVPDDQPVELNHGDLVGVGQSLLLFRT